MKTFQIEMTAEQAQRFTRLAALFHMTTGELIAQQALASLDGAEPADRLEFIAQIVERRSFYATAASVHPWGKRIEDELAPASKPRAMARKRAA